MGLMGLISYMSHNPQKPKTSQKPHNSHKPLSCHSQGRFSLFLSVVHYEMNDPSPFGFFSSPGRQNLLYRRRRGTERYRRMAGQMPVPFGVERRYAQSAVSRVFARPHNPPHRP